MNTKTTPKDFFLNLGATIALYVAAGALINLSFSVINYFEPDPLAGYFYGNSVAWPISILIVLVPIFYVLEWMINRDIRKNPEKSEIWIRKWRIYLTIFLSIVLFGGDLIALINVYLNGEITSRFVYKIIIVLLVAGSIGKYYAFSILTAHRWSKIIRRSNAWFGIVLVLLAIIFGFVAVGSPAKQRAMRFDNQRVNDLSNIQWQVINYWQNKEKLPQQLSDLNDSVSGFVVPSDPSTKDQYQYSIKQSTTTSNPTFELCAVFDLESQDLKGRGAYDGSVSYPVAYDFYPNGNNDVWKHGIGQTCFERTIDPDRYPTNKLQAIPAKGI